MVAVGRSRLERGAVLSSLHINVGACVEQSLGDITLAQGRSRLEGGATPSSLCVDVGACIEQSLILWCPQTVAAWRAVPKNPPCAVMSAPASKSCWETCSWPPNEAALSAVVKYP